MLSVGLLCHPPHAHEDPDPVQVLEFFEGLVERWRRAADELS